ncbi:DUF5683 domain-containing protein [Jiulongibacter sp. NS-SX5]|uniref:DUF5683 domain-containing protein n=1 Tax=Jiulongibacter sp. NS-SX5 TaxID=3463854 RepID=UPI004059F23E
MRAIILLYFSLFVAFTSFGQAEADSLVSKVEDVIAEQKAPKDTTKSFGKTMGRVFGLRPYTALQKPQVSLIRSLLLPGWGQITNRDFWKVGIVYGAAGAGWYFGIRSNGQQYQKYLGHYERATFISRNLAFYEGDELLSANAISTSSFYVSNDGTNGTLYILDEENNKYVLDRKEGEVEGVETPYFIARQVDVADNEIIGAFNSNTFESAKNQYRRWRDASYIGFAAGWLFFALEANVAAHLKTFDMSEDISFRIEPAGPQTFGSQAAGISLGLHFK